MESKKDVQVMVIHDIVEENGKTIKQNNMELKHNIPLDTLVEVKYDVHYDDGCCEKIHARLWVNKHTRDCDGEPLYNLSTWKTESVETIQAHFGKYAIHFHGPFSEDDLTPIKVTEDLVYGALKWKDDEK